MAGPESVEAYLAGLTDERREAMDRLREAIRAAAPEATESIAYAMPAFRSHGGQFLVSYAAYRANYSLLRAREGVVAGRGEEFAPFLSGKGTIRFPADRPIPVGLVGDIVRIRFAENAARERR
jgi:uncharacterized protein YdhG (YjbR/CyaY superfamily)